MTKHHPLEPTESAGSVDAPVDPARRSLFGKLALAGTALALLDHLPQAAAQSASSTTVAPPATMAAAPDANAAIKRGLNLMPWPAEITYLGEARIDFPERVPLHLSSGMSPRAERAIRRFTANIERKSRTRFGRTRSGSGSGLRITVAAPGRLAIGADESYALKVEPHGIELQSATDLGLIHGLATLDQLLTVDGDRLVGYSLSIADRPRFAWRGLMIDTARHFQPLPVLRRNLRGMEAVKLNVLHLHLSDNQGFRVESRVLPKLTTMGSNGQFYTQREVKDLIAYAADRGILIVPEFDMPSHAVSWFVGYPELASAPGPYQLYTHFGGQMASFDPTHPDTYKVLDQFFEEMSGLFASPYMHIGGDENSGQQWTFNPAIQAYMHDLQAPPITSNAQLQTQFTNRVSHIVAAHGKTPIGWDEVLQPGVQKDIIIQSWRGNEALIRAAESGYKAVLSHGYYLDLYHFTSDYYLNDPIPPGTAISAAAASNILGGEAEMWSELASPDIIDSRIWPNTAAIAERLWSPVAVRDVDWMYARLKPVNQALAAVGLTQRSGPADLLENLGGSAGAATLTGFARLVSPIRDYQRSRSQYTTTTPFDSLVDAASTPAWGAIEFQQGVEVLRRAQDNEQLAKVRAILTTWDSLGGRLGALASRSVKLADLAPFAPALGTLSRIGLVACDYLQRGSPVPAEWARSVTNALIAADQPYADLRLRVVASVRDLVSLAIVRGRGLPPIG